MVAEILIKVERCLDLGECSKFGAVVLDKESTVRILDDLSVESANRNVLNSEICIVASSNFDSFRLIKIKYMNLLLHVFIPTNNRVSFYNNIIGFWFLYFKQEVFFLVVSKSIL